jgi:hypothetical protein
MKVLILLGMLMSTAAMADPAEVLCARDPAFSQAVMLKIVQAELEVEHDPALDADTPENIAKQAQAQGISECAAEVRRDPSIAAAFAGLNPADEQVAWDAYNTACANRKAGRGACISAEVQSGSALKRMITTDRPEGAKTLVQTCELVMQTDPAMAEWRECVDAGLALHPSEAAAKRCKLSATWHVAKTGAEAGAIVAACLKGG